MKYWLSGPLGTDAPLGIELLGLILALALWELYWKGRGLWLAAERKDHGWFIALLILNTIGILPLLYIYVFSKKSTPKG